MTRLSRHEYFMQIAVLVAQRSTCDRAHVGCVLVSRKKHIISTGYNGSLVGGPHCDDVGHDLVEGHCIRTVHAEANAICAAAKLGTPTENCIAYVTHLPCLNCTKLLINSGITEVHYLNDYGSEKSLLWFEDKGILCHHHPMPSLEEQAH